MPTSIWTLFQFLFCLLAVGVTARLGLHYEADDYAVHLGYPQHNGSELNLKSEYIQRASQTPPDNLDVPVTPNPARWFQTSTFYARIPQPAPPKQWNHGTVRTVAMEFWKKIRDQYPAEKTTIVAALWIYGHGIFLGTIPHGAPPDTPKDQVKYWQDGQGTFKASAPSVAPLLWRNIWNRKLTTKKSTSLWHAEDMAAYNWELYLGEQYALDGRTAKTSYRYCWSESDIQIKPAKLPTYPPHSFVTTFGKYRSNYKEDWVKPCGSLEPNKKTAMIDPACSIVMTKIGVIIDESKEDTSSSGSDRDAEGELDYDYVAPAYGVAGPSNSKQRVR